MAQASPPPRCNRAMWKTFSKFHIRRIAIGGACISGAQFVKQDFADKRFCAAEVAKPTPKTVLITGGSRGIGRACALQCAREGWQVAVNYASDESAANEVKRQVECEGGRAVVVQGNIVEAGLATRVRGLRKL